MTLSQSCISSRSTTSGYAATVDMCLNGSKDQCENPSSFEESCTRPKYHEGKQASRNPQCFLGLAWLARARTLFPLAALRWALQELASRGLAILRIVKRGSRLVYD
ncbi:hypothetical protein RF11_11665 [Thelohanellus kitauei]|uniref:Uncharacterized protein n=1 Tax=Thelohanellus kitauei TaxID=669202 RepID=A0A0C2MDF1_THEKT|nr:hypothetical protein RF11_11665 [Thelohanellus kitauei]